MTKFHAVRMQGRWLIVSKDGEEIATLAPRATESMALVIARALSDADLVQDPGKSKDEEEVEAEAPGSVKVVPDATKTPLVGISSPPPEPAKPAPEPPGKATLFLEAPLFEDRGDELTCRVRVRSAGTDCIVDLALQENEWRARESTLPPEHVELVVKMVARAHARSANSSPPPA